jgi:hypothetical protein
MKSLRGLEGMRWFIWTIVIMFVTLGSLAAYIVYTSQTESLDLVSGSILPRREYISPVSAVEQNNKLASTSIIVPESKITQLDTSKWKIYENTSQHIKFLYPANWKISTTPDPDFGNTARLSLQLINAKDFPKSGAQQVNVMVVNKTDYENPGGEGISDLFKTVKNPKDRSTIYVNVYMKRNSTVPYEHGRSDPSEQEFYKKYDQEQATINNQIHSIFNSIQGI